MIYPRDFVDDDEDVVDLEDAADPEDEYAETYSFSLNFFDCVESKTIAKTPSSPNDDEEELYGRDGNVHQLVTDFSNQPRHDDQHIATPIDNYCFMSNLYKSSEPSSFKEALRDVN
nr:hypothetical protein [Tanacetum cinerariifolium]